MALFGLKNKIIKLINKSGYDITKLNTDELKYPVIKKDLYNPKKILFYAKFNRLPFLCYVPPEQLRGHVMNFSFDDDNHPFKKAILEAVNSKNEYQAIKDSLDDFYKNNKPESPAEVLGLNEKELPNLSDKPAWVAIHPWEDRTIDEVEEKRPDLTQRENKRKGKDIDIDEGWHLFGPVSKDKLEIEAKRVYELFKKIEKEGYSAYNNNNNIIATILIDQENDKMKWVVYDGQHRTSILSALDYEKVPVLVKKIVSRNDVEFWPGVVSGDFTKESALKIFDRVINEVPPKIN